MGTTTTGTRIFVTLTWSAKARLGTGATFWRDEETSLVRVDTAASPRNGDPLAEDEVAALPDVLCLDISPEDRAKGRRLDAETAHYHCLADLDLQPDDAVTVFDAEADPHILLASQRGVPTSQYRFPLIDDFFDDLIGRSGPPARTPVVHAPRHQRHNRIQPVPSKPAPGSRKG